MIVKIYEYLSYLLFILMIALYPIMLVILSYRMLKGKEIPSRVLERFGITCIKRPEGELVWIHAASVGETQSVMPIINRLIDDHKDLNILLTTGTVTSARVAHDQVHEKVIHQFMPMDLTPTIMLFLRKWKPNLTIWIESEFWPNILKQTSQLCPIILVNGRVSDKSFKAWSRYPQFIKKILSYFTTIIAQSDQDKERFIQLGAELAVNCGNIKYASPPFAADPIKLEDLKTQIGDRRVFMAASTHIGEEEQIINVHKHLKEYYPDLVTIIAPRHPARRDDIMKLFIEHEVNASVRSLHDQIMDTTDIYLADTLGEYGIFYRLAHIVFVGGSLVPRGGHNILEPARLDNAIIVGPHTFNFAEITNEFLDQGACIKVQDDEELFKTLHHLFAHLSRLDELIKTAKVTVNKCDNVLEDIMERVTPFISRHKV
jgi:3-deoxy-D-manno-octulosonic-acid transferase